MSRSGKHKLDTDSIQQRVGQKIIIMQEANPGEGGVELEEVLFITIIMS